MFATVMALKYALLVSRCSYGNRVVTVDSCNVTSPMYYTQGDSDVISFRIYASWFLPPSCGQKSWKCLLLCCHLNTLCRWVNDHMDIFLKLTG